MLDIDLVSLDSISGLNTPIRQGLGYLVDVSYFHLNLLQTNFSLSRAANI